MIAEGAARGQGTRAPLLLCTGTATHFTSLNSDWERILGWTERELMSRPFADFVHPGDRERTLAEASKVGSPGYEVVDFENRIRARGGQWRRLRWRGRADGYGWVAAAIDVTDEVRVDLPASWLNGAPVAPVANGAAVAASPIVARGSDLSRGRNTAIARAGLSILAVAALLIAARGVGGGDIFSGAGPLPAHAVVREIPRHMHGPVNGAGPVYTLGRVALHPPQMLGPRIATERPR